MNRKLNLRVSEAFADQLELVARRMGQPMAVVLESVATPALSEAVADAQFEADALEARDAYMLTGAAVSVEAIDGMFAAAADRARAVGTHPSATGQSRE